MGRFSPTVAPVANDGLANALGNFTETYMQFSARKRQKDMDAIQTGVGLTPVDPNAAAAPPSGLLHSIKSRLYGAVGKENPDDAAYSREQQPSIEAALAQNAATNRATAGSRFNAGQGPNWQHADTSAPSFVARRPSTGGNYASDDYPDLPQQMRLPSGQVISTAMTPVGQRMLQTRLAALGLNSEIGLRNSETRLNERKAAAPVLGEAGYAKAMGDVAGAEANAKLPADIQAAVAKGQIDLATGKQLALIRGQIDAALQGNQQQFTAGENTKNRSAESERQTTAKGEDLSNKLKEIEATQGGQLGPNLVKIVKGFVRGGQINVPGVTRPLGSKESAPATAAPSGDVKTQRADWDAAAAHARQQGKDPDELLGPRP